MTTQEKFFHENAGFSYGPSETPEQGRERMAVAYAAAETHAAQAGWRVEWVADQDGCSGCDCGSPDCACSSGEPHQTLCAILRDGSGAVLASLGSICGATRDYRRVVEAELALEAMPSEVSA